MYLRSFIRARVADVDEAEDILQDVFEELVSAYRLVRPVEQVAGWLHGVAYRLALKARLRAHKPLPEQPTAPVPLTPPEQLTMKEAQGLLTQAQAEAQRRFDLDMNSKQAQLKNLTERVQALVEREAKLTEEIHAKATQLQAVNNSLNDARQRLAG